MIDIELLEQKKWTEFLLSLPEGNVVISVKCFDDLLALKSVAYRINSNEKYPNVFSIRKQKSAVLIIVKPRNEV